MVPAARLFPKNGRAWEGISWIDPTGITKTQTRHDFRGAT